MKEIIISGRLVAVPPGYIQAEAEYTKDELDIFNTLSPGAKKEEARIAILEMREEFYQLYIAGKVNLEPTPKPQLTFWQKLAYTLRGGKWPK